LRAELGYSEILCEEKTLDDVAGRKIADMTNDRYHASLTFSRTNMSFTRGKKYKCAFLYLDGGVENNGIVCTGVLHLINRQP